MPFAALLALTGTMSRTVDAQILRVEQVADRSAIVVNAQGEAVLRADRATLGITIEGQSETAPAAVAQASRIQQAVLDTLRAIGVPAANLSSVNYGVTPIRTADVRRQGEPPRVIAYLARSSVRVDTDRLDQLNDIASAAIAKGATQIATPSFTSRATDSARAAALANAARQARADATAIAAVLGGRLGRLIELSSHGPPVPSFRQQQYTYYDYGPAPPPPPPPPPAPGGVGRFGGGAATSVSPGEMVMTASVSAKWEFLPGAQP